MKKKISKTKKTPKKHAHSFVIERGGFDSTSGQVSFLDMRCSCGMPLFCPKPTTHRGDGPNRLLRVDEI